MRKAERTKDLIHSEKFLKARAKDMDRRLADVAEKNADLHRRLEAAARPALELTLGIASRDKVIKAQNEVIVHLNTRLLKWRKLFWQMMNLDDTVTADGKAVPFNEGTTRFMPSE